MAKMIGADTEALDRLAHQFDNAADRLRNHAGQVSNGIQIAAWAGPVAVRFRADWDSTHSVSLKAAAEVLKDNAKTLRLNAAEQRAASNSLEGDAGSKIRVKQPENRSPWDAIRDRVTDWAEFFRDQWNGGVGAFLDSLSLLGQSLNQLTDFFRNNWRTLSKIARIAGRTLPLVSAGMSIYTMYFSDADEYTKRDAAISLGLTGAGLIAVVAAPPVGIAIAAVGVVWGVGTVVSDTPLSKRAHDAWKRARPAIQEQLRERYGAAGRGAQNLASAGARGIANVLRPPRGLFGF